MEYTRGGDRVKAREQLTIVRPDKLRLEAYYAFGLGLVLVSNGKEVDIYDPPRNVLFVGRPTSATLDRFAHIKLEPGKIVNLLMSLPPDDDLAAEVPAYLRRDDGLLIVGLPIHGRSNTELEFAHSTLRAVRERNTKGDTEYEVKYDDYRDVGGIQIAHKIKAQFFDDKTTVEFRYKQAVANRLFPDSTFIISPPSTTTRVNLEQEATSSAS